MRFFYLRFSGTTCSSLSPRSSQIFLKHEDIAFLAGPIIPTEISTLQVISCPCTGIGIFSMRTTTLKLYSQNILYLKVLFDFHMWSAMYRDINHKFIIAIGIYIILHWKNITSFIDPEQ